MKIKSYRTFVFLLAFLSAVMSQAMAAEGDVINVVKHGVRNDSLPIGTELNQLVKQSYGKTLYFPAGTYTLTEPIVLPMDYAKNVNLLLDKNATIRSAGHLDALLKVGFSERTYKSREGRLSSYVEGGQWDCRDADNGIYVNAMKQMVQLRDLTLFDGDKCHIRVQAYEGEAPGSSDTKIDNVTIQGRSSDSDSYGIYFGAKTNDNKVTNCFIYGTRCAIYSECSGQLINNVHILSCYRPGGYVAPRGERFNKTVGIYLKSSGFNHFNQIYFDTVDRGIVVASGHTPSLVLEKCIWYSYLPDFGRYFLQKENPNDSAVFEVRLTDCLFEVCRDDFKVFDVNPFIVKNNNGAHFSAVNTIYRNVGRLSPLCPSLSQRIRGVSYDAIARSPRRYESTWYVLGGLAPGYGRQQLRLTFDDNTAYDVLLNSDAGVPTVEAKALKKSKLKIDFKLSSHEGYGVLLFRPSVAGVLYPEVRDVSGQGRYMVPPSCDRRYRPADYGLPSAE